MSEPNQDHFEGGIATLSADPTDNFDETNPWKVSGVALPENTILKGGQGVEHFYTAETLEGAGELLEGSHIVKNFHDIDGQATADDIIGEVTNAGYQKGVGLVFDGEITDREIAEKVSHGYLDVSPSPVRSLGEFNDSMGGQEVQRLVDFRDLAVVGNGQPGAKIEMGPNPAVEALSLDALSNGFDVLEGESTDPLKQVAGVEFTGTADGKLDEADIPNDDFASHYLYPGDTKSESSYPVVDAEGNLRKGNVDAAWQLGARGGVEADEHDRKLMDLAAEFDNPPEWATEEQDTNKSPARSDFEACGISVPDDFSENDDGENGSTPQSSAAAANKQDTMSNETELSDAERDILRAAEDVENAQDVLNEYADADSPEVVEQDVLEAKDDQLDEFAGVFRDALKQNRDLKESTVEAMPVDTLAEEFRGEDGDLKVDSLAQNPETQTTNGGDETPSVDTLSGEEKSEIKEKLRRAAMLEGRTPDHVDTLRSEAAELAGVEDADEIEVDAL